MKYIAAAAPWLVKVMLGRREDLFCTMLLADTLAATRERRAIPLVMSLLDQTETRARFDILPHIGGRFPMNRKEITFAVSDAALLALIRLTDQKPADYGMAKARASTGYWRVVQYGFGTDEERQRAIRAFRAWWRIHKDKPPYADSGPGSIEDSAK